MRDEFSSRLLNWYKTHGRKQLPWKNTPANPYHIWLSEVMLQQTQVSTVIPYFYRFIEKFPNIENLAQASIDQVLSLWSGLGYYTRAHNLHKTAQIISQQYQHQFPSDLEQIKQLPGIGQSTAGAIYSFAFNGTSAILDGNCRRVYSRYCGIKGLASQANTQKELWQTANDLTNFDRCSDYNQAIMDLGALVCKRHKPLCLSLANACPVSSNCYAFQQQCINDFPQKKSKKTKKPEKNTIFLLIFNKKQQILLEKRSISGVWPNLWCFPQVDTEQEINQKLLCKKHQIIYQSSPFKHQFSHYQLNYQLRHIKIFQDNMVESSDNSQWFSTDDAKQLGIPSPIKKAIEYFEQTLNNIENV